MRPARSLLFNRFLHSGLILSLVLASGCKGASNLPTAPVIADNANTIFSMEIDGAARSVTIGTTLPLQAVGKTDADVSVPVQPTWKSSDPGIASVSAAGIVTGLKKGKATVTATLKNPPREAKLALIVLGPGETVPAEFQPPAGGFDPEGGMTPIDEGPGGFQPPDGSGDLPSDGGAPAPEGFALALYPAAPRVNVGERLRMVSFENRNGREVQAPSVWRSSDASVATVDEAGVVTGLKAGTVTLTASSLAYPALRRSTPLTVVAPARPTDIQGIRITPSRVNMNIGETFWLLAEVPTFTGGFDASVRWEVGDESIVTVSETGQITALAPGRTTVTAIATTYTQGELSATIPVEVRNATSGF